MASVIVSPLSTATRRAASQRSSGTRTARCGVLGWLGTLPAILQAPGHPITWFAGLGATAKRVALAVHRLQHPYAAVADSPRRLTIEMAQGQASKAPAVDILLADNIRQPTVICLDLNTDQVLRRLAVFESWSSHVFRIAGVYTPVKRGNAV